MIFESIIYLQIKMTSAEEYLILIKISGFMISTLSQPYLTCSIGQQVDSLSLEIRVKLFHSNWYIQPKKYKRKLIMFQERLKKSISINLCGFGYLNYNTFLLVIKFDY